MKMLGSPIIADDNHAEDGAGATEGPEKGVDIAPEWINVSHFKHLSLEWGSGLNFLGKRVFVNIINETSNIFSKKMGQKGLELAFFGPK